MKAKAMKIKAIIKSPYTNPGSSPIPFLLLSLLLASSKSFSHLSMDHLHPYEKLDALAGFVASFFHPMTGLDHLVALLAVGILSMQDQRKVWLQPLLFLFSMIFGFASTQVLPSFNYLPIEFIISLSLIFLGTLLLATTPGSPARTWSLGALSFFAFFHGFAHGQELLKMASPATAVLGMILGSLIIQVLGINIGRLIVRNRLWWRRLGTSVAMLELFLLFSL